MTILAIDLGKFKSVSCFFDPASQKACYRTLPTTPAAVHDLMVSASPGRVVIEVCTSAGWVADLAEALGIDVQVANPNTEGWRWNHVKRKTDRDDALKLVKLSAAGQLPTVHLPGAGVRRWRSLIVYRHKLVARRTAIYNRIRALLDSVGRSPAKRRVVKRPPSPRAARCSLGAGRCCGTNATGRATGPPDGSRQPAHPRKYSRRSPRNSEVCKTHPKRRKMKPTTYGEGEPDNRRRPRLD